MLRKDHNTLIMFTRMLRWLKKLILEVNDKPIIIMLEDMAKKK